MGKLVRINFQCVCYVKMSDSFSHDSRKSSMPERISDRGGYSSVYSSSHPESVICSSDEATSQEERPWSLGGALFSALNATQDLTELTTRLHLLRDARRVDTDEAFDLAVKRFNDLSEFLGKLLRKEMQSAT